MGCFPAATGPLEDMRYNNPGNHEKFRHDSTDRDTALGGRFHTWPLAPKLSLTPEQSADLEIRRALREGVDGFAIDAWAGGDLSKQTLDALFTAAEAGHYPFEITVCIDAWCVSPHGEDGYYEAIKHLLDKHGSSPNLARRDGKPLIFTYQGQGIGMEIDRSNQEGWAKVVDTYKDLETRLGQPLYVYLDISTMFMKYEDKLGMSRDDAYVAEARYFGSHYFGAIGGFTDWTDRGVMPKIADAVHAGTAEWASPMWYQYINVVYGGGPTRTQDGIGQLFDNWQRARDEKSTLLQFITWNDYGEHTSLAPTEASGYGIGDLNAYFATWWKTGKEPRPDHDRVYVTYRIHTGDHPSFPWRGEGQAPTQIEVVTILPQAAQIRLPGRGDGGKPLTYTAPPGFSIKTFPLTPGPVDVEVVHDGNVTAQIHGREPVTDRPFRHDATLYCASTEDAKYWNEDFPGQPYPTDSYYADDDHNGLPNWFEMYWLGKWNDFSTATGHDPKSDPFHTGKTLLQHYLDQTDPTKVPASYPAGWVWDITSLGGKSLFNPDVDPQGTPVWYYLYQEADAGQSLPHDGKYKRMAYGERDGWWSNSKCAGRIDWKPATTPPVLQIRGTPTSHAGNCMPILGWQSPIDGTVSVDLQVSKPASEDGDSKVSLERTNGAVLWSYDFSKDGETGNPVNVPEVKVAKGDWLYLINDDASKQVTVDLYKITVKGP